MLILIKIFVPILDVRARRRARCCVEQLHARSLSASDGRRSKQVSRLIFVSSVFRKLHESISAAFLQDCHVGIRGHPTHLSSSSSWGVSHASLAAPSFASLGLNTELKVEATFSASFTLLLVLACSFSRAALHLNDMNTTRMDIE